MNAQRDSAYQVVARCKGAGVPVVAGGPLFVSEHESFADVDHFVLNEAEITLPLFLEDLARGCAKRLYSTTGFADVQRSPIPRWELVDLDAYGSACVQFSRGCPYDCEFCSVTALLGHRPRTKTAAQIIAELDYLYALGWRGNVGFVDDNLIGNKKVLKNEVLPALIEWRRDKVGLPFFTETAISLVDDEELVRLMVQAGFESVFVGIETVEQASLAEASKVQNRSRDLLVSVKRLQRAGLRVQGGFIVGFDSDTPAVFQRQIDFIQQSGVVIAMVGMLQAIYPSRLYERLQREGRLSGEFLGDMTAGMTNIVPKMGLEALKQGHRRILREIYAPRAYYERIQTLLRELSAPKIKSRLEWVYLLGFLRALYRLGVREADRGHFWRLFLWTLLRRPRSFPLAIVLSIYGYHFRRVSGLNSS
jgi:radical SAM superfamily enzyme YgiQ (UPF0313 family)